MSGCSRLGVLSVCALGLVLRAFPAAAAEEASSHLPLERRVEIAKAFAKHFPEAHLSGLAMDDTVSSHAWTNYLNALDPEHCFFMASDVQQFRQVETNLDDRLAEGDVAFAFGVFDLFKDRVSNRCVHVEAELKRGFDFHQDESFVWRGKDLPWPDGEQAWDDLWRRRLKNQYIRYVLSRENGLTGKDDDDGEPAPAPKEDGGAATNTNSVPPPTPEEMILKQYQQLLTVLQDSDAEWVLERYLTSFAQAYDPHSDYMSPGSLENFNIEMQLSLEGIGAMLRPEDGTAKIMEIIPGGPADRDKRLKAGDRIIAVGQGDKELVDTLHWPLNRVVSLIRGPKGTTVTLLVLPASDTTGLVTKRLSIVRDTVKLEERAAKLQERRVKRPDGTVLDLAVIRVPAFYANVNARSKMSPDYRSSADDVMKILKDLQAKAVPGVILDLRNDGGGYLPEAVQMAGLFIRTGPIVQVKDRERVVVWPDNDPMVAYTGSLVVLVNRVSASASEIVAGALQDYGRAVVVGDSKTHGKGTVQRLLSLEGDPGLGSIKITSASYYRVSGASTQLRGVAPDIAVPSVYDSFEYGEDFLPNSIPWSRIAAIEHENAADLSTLRPVLRERSLARRAGDQRMSAYARLLERITEMNRRRDVPLDIEKRRALAAAEKELIDLQNKASASEEVAEGGGKKEDDIILDEAFNILADLVSLQPGGGTPRADDTKSVFDSLLELFEK